MQRDYTFATEQKNITNAIIEQKERVNTLCKILTISSHVYSRQYQNGIDLNFPSKLSRDTKKLQGM